MKSLVITGVSSGIGYDVARHLLGDGWRVFGSVRQPADAARVQAELGDGFTPLLFDVTDADAIAQAVSVVATAVADGGLTALINNAGIATPGPLMHLTAADLRQQLEINVVGVLQTTQAFLPLLGARQNSPHPPGRIVNISSVSGEIAYPFMGAYAASKHALEALSDSWRRELLLYGIDVILIQPGTVQTPIVGKFREQIERFLGTDYGRILQPMAANVDERERTAIPVAKVSRVIAEALTADKPKTRYPVPRKWLTGWLLPRWLPDRWFDRQVAKRLGF